MHLHVLYLTPHPTFSAFAHLFTLARLLAARCIAIAASLEPDGTLKIVVPDDAIEHRKNRNGPPPTEKIEVKPSAAA